MGNTGKAANGKTVTQNVTDLLKAFPEARNNDKMLFALYWGLIDGVDFTNFDTFVETFTSKATPASSIQRRRQYINYRAKDPILPTDPSILAYRRKQGELLSDGELEIKLRGETLGEG